MELRARCVQRHSGLIAASRFFCAPHRRASPGLLPCGVVRVSCGVRHVRVCCVP